MFAQAWLCQLYRSHQDASHSRAGQHSLLHPRLKPCSPLDCPACCLCSSSCSLTGRLTSLPVQLWSEIKSQRVREMVRRVKLGFLRSCSIEWKTWHEARSEACSYTNRGGRMSRTDEGSMFRTCRGRMSQGDSPKIEAGGHHLNNEIVAHPSYCCLLVIKGSRMAM